jgi:hypothetical protein
VRGRGEGEGEGVNRALQRVKRRPRRNLRTKTFRGDCTAETLSPAWKKDEIRDEKTASAGAGVDGGSPRVLARQGRRRDGGEPGARASKKRT